MELASIPESNDHHSLWAELQDPSLMRNRKFSQSNRYAGHGLRSISIETDNCTSEMDTISTQDSQEKLYRCYKSTRTNVWAICPKCTCSRYVKRSYVHYRIKSSDVDDHRQSVSESVYRGNIVQTNNDQT